MVEGASKLWEDLLQKNARLLNLGRFRVRECKTYARFNARADSFFIRMGYKMKNKSKDIKA